MAVLVIKNALLILLMILILHFMIRNKLVDDRNTFRRRLIYMDTARPNKQMTTHGEIVQAEEAQENVALVAAVTDAGSGVVSKMSFRQPAATDIVDGDEASVDADVVADVVAVNEPEDEDDDNVTVLAAETAEPVSTKCAATKGGKRRAARMKELYDFVYSEEDGKPRGSGGSNISKYFPEGVKDGATVDRTEIVEHSKAVSKKLRAKDTHTTCNFEVIGSLCGAGERVGEDRIQGMEQSTASFYSEL